VLSIFISVSFLAPSAPLLIGEKQMSIGSAHIAVKKLNGAALAVPFPSTVETKAMGRGRIDPTNNLYASLHSSVCGEISMTFHLNSINL
jgi:hypothetical protein